MSYNTILHCPEQIIIIDRSTGNIYEIKADQIKVIASCDPVHIALNFIDKSTPKKIIKLIKAYEHQSHHQ
jgi:hypothetical protein